MKRFALQIVFGILITVLFLIWFALLVGCLMLYVSLLWWVFVEKLFESHHHITTYQSFVLATLIAFALVWWKILRRST